MNSKILNMFFAFMAFFAVEANADNNLSLSPVNGIAGQHATLSVNLSNTDEIVALSFELTLPSGVTIAKSGSEYKATLVSARKPSGASIVCGDPQNNTYVIAEYSTTNGTFSAGSGAIVNVTLDISSSAAASSEITISNIELTKADLSSVNPEGSSAALTVKSVTGTHEVAELVSIEDPYATDIAASGGKTLAIASVNYKSWTRTFYSDNSYDDSNIASKSMSIYGEYVSAENLGSTVTSRQKVGTSTATGVIPVKDVNGADITVTAAPLDIYQAANGIVSYDDVEISFKGSDNVTIPAGNDFNLVDAITVNQNATFASGASGSGNVSVFYNVVKSPEGFNPLAIDENAAVVSVQSTADLTIAKDFTVRVLALGEGNKVTTADILFSATQSTAVKSISGLETDGSRIYDLNGRIVNVSEDQLSHGAYIIGNKKVMK